MFRRGRSGTVKTYICSLVPKLSYIRTTEQAGGGKTVGVDPTLITAPDARKLSENLKKKAGGSLIGESENLVDRVWGADRPQRPEGKIMVLPEKYSGNKFGSKIEEVRKELDKKKAAGIIISMLDEVAWLFNLRGSDIPYNPVFFSYAAVTPTTATIYVDSDKLTDEVKDHLGTEVAIRPYDSLLSDLTAMSESAPAMKDADATGSAPVLKKRYLISTRASWASNLGLGGEEQVDEIRSPVADAKAIKNDTELQGDAILSHSRWCGAVMRVGSTPTVFPPPACSVVLM